MPRRSRARVDLDDPDMDPYAVAPDSQVRITTSPVAVAAAAAAAAMACESHTHPKTVQHVPIHDTTIEAEPAAGTVPELEQHDQGHIQTPDTSTSTTSRREIPIQHETSSDKHDESLQHELKHESKEQLATDTETPHGGPQVDSAPQTIQQSRMKRWKSRIKHIPSQIKRVTNKVSRVPEKLGRWGTLASILLPVLALSAPFLLPLLTPYVARLDVTHPNTVWQVPTMAKPHMPEWITRWTSGSGSMPPSTTSTPPPASTSASPSLQSVPPVPEVSIVLQIPVAPAPSTGSIPSTSTSPVASSPSPSPSPSSGPVSLLSSYENIHLPVPLSSFMYAIDRLAGLTKEQREMLEMRPDLMTSDLLPPVSKDHLGRVVWTFLHTIAAAYPTEPTTQQQLLALNLIDAIVGMYPCPSCHEHFKHYVAYHPPDVSSKTAFSVWLCRAHNEINTRLGRPSVDCNPNHLAMMWPDTVTLK